MLELHFRNCEPFQEGITRLQSLLGYKQTESGIAVEAVHADHLGAEYHGDTAKVYYRDRCHFFRALGLLIEQMCTSKDFRVIEQIDFDTVGVMIDSSRGGVPTVEGICRYLDQLAVMGYNMVMMYTEDTFTIPERPFFGYMRGRYTEDELRRCDDYAYAYGIEMIPCIEAYGHMAQYLQWPEAAPVKDTASVLLADEPQTYELLDDMIRCASLPFRSKRIHIGMDEAWDMGRGRYMDLHGEVPRFDIFNSHMDKLMRIVEKYQLTPMMWSDMYFRIASGGEAYYDVTIEIPDDIRAKIPENMQLVFWHYGEGPGCDDAMLAKHVALGRDVIYAGGLWCWTGHMPENHYAFEATKTSIDACRKHRVREMMTTIWANNGNDYHPTSLLLGLSFTAEMAYHAEPDEELLRKRFEFCTGGSWDAFWEMSSYHNTFGPEERYPNFHDRFFGKPLFWQDVLEGIYDLPLWQKPMHAHYESAAARMEQFGGKWQELYAYTALLFRFLAAKTRVAETLKPAYDRKDKETLTSIRDTLLPELISFAKQVHTAHRGIWSEWFKSTGWKSLDFRYGGMIARMESALEQLTAYLAGGISAIDELEEERLPQPLGGFITSTAIFRPFF